MTRTKLEGYQDSYALAMSKYGLQRGIRGSEARHATAAEYNRGIFIQVENAKNEYEQIQQQKDEKEQVLNELKRKEAQRVASLQQEISQKESELEDKQKQLREVKNEVVKVGFEKSAKEAGKGFMEGIDKLMGNPKVKKLEEEVSTLKNEIVNLGTEKANENKKHQAELAQRKDIIAKKDELINTQQTKLDKLFESIPILKDYDFIIRLSERIRIPFDIVKQIFSGKAVSYTGELYSPEHERNFKADSVTFTIDKSKENKPLLVVDGKNYISWFREQQAKFLEKLGIKPKEQKKQYRMGR